MTTMITDEAHNPSLSPLLLLVVAPKRAFSALAVTPRWALTLLVLVICTVVYTIVIHRYVDVAATMEAQMASQHITDPAQREKLINAATTLIRFTPLASTFLLLISLLGIAGSLFAALYLAGIRTEFRRVFSVTVHAWIPVTLKWLVAATVVAIRAKPFIGDASLLLKSNLGALLTSPQHSYRGVVLSAVDLFDLWSVVLFIIGTSAVTLAPWKKSVTIVCILWLISVALQLPSR